MKYIDADLLRKEIERQVTHTMQCMGGKITGEPVISARKLLAFLDTLEVEENPIVIQVENPNIQKLDPNVIIETRTNGTGEPYREPIPGVKKVF